ncbi:MAG: hypothetical protein ACP5D2_04165 [Candidatus Nanoarchaeia archaeon]
MKIETTTKTTEFERPHIEEDIKVAELREVKEISEGQYGPRVAFVYHIIDDDVELAHVCYKNKATEDNKIGKVLMAHGLEIKDGEVDTEPLIGTKVRVMVEDYTYEVEEEGKKVEKTASSISKVKPLAEKA